MFFKPGVTCLLLLHLYFHITLVHTDHTIDTAAEREEEGQVPGQTASKNHTSLQDQVLDLLESETVQQLKDTAAFNIMVLQSDFPVVVLLRAPSIDWWKRKAYELRGIVRVFACSNQLIDELLSSMGIEENDMLVYPAGIKEGQAGEPTKLSSADEAVSVALASLSDEVVRLRRETVSELLVDAIEAVPSTFPVLILTKKDEIRPGLRAIIPRLGRYFRFGVLAKAPKSVLDEMELDTETLIYPTMLILTVNRGMEEGEANPIFGAVQYESEQENSWTYPHLLDFFLDVNHKYRRNFIGETQSDSREVREMSDVMEDELHRLSLMINVVQTKGKEEL